MFKKKKMATYIFIAFCIVIIACTGYIVWTNWASETIRTNVGTVLGLGIISLLVTSIISLKEEKIKDNYGACMFIELNPFHLLNYGIHLKPAERTYPLIMTANCIEAISDKDSSFFPNMLSKDSSARWKLYNELFTRYLIDILQARYRGGWYLKSTYIKTPGGATESNSPIELLKSEVFDDKMLSKVFVDNPFINVGYFNVTKSNSNNEKFKPVKMPFGVNFPPETKLRYSLDTTFSSSVLTIDNGFVEIEIKYKPTLGLGNVNDDICKAYHIDSSKSENYYFLPYLIETKTTFKKFKSGSPDMEKYKYWANDLTSLLKQNISVEEFWRQIELNK